MPKIKTKGNTKIQFILAMIAGIYELIGGLIYLFFGNIVNVSGPLIASRLTTIIGLLLLIFSAFFILGSILMKEGKRKGAITTLVVSIIALITLQLIPGALGLVAAIIALKKK